VKSVRHRLLYLDVDSPEPVVTVYDPTPPDLDTKSAQQEARTWTFQTKRLIWGTRSLLDRATASILRQQQRITKDVYTHLWSHENKIVTGDFHENLAHGLLSQYHYMFHFSSYTGHSRDFLSQESKMVTPGKRVLTLTQKLRNEVRFHRSKDAAVAAITSAQCYDYLRPYETNFPVMDSFTKIKVRKEIDNKVSEEVEGVAFQMTIAKKHKSDTKKQECAAILKECKIKVLHLIWIPHPGSFSSWPTQLINLPGITVYQYRMDISDFETPIVETS